MPYTLIIHIQNADPVVGEVDDLPGSGDRLILLKNPRHRDGKDLQYLDENVDTVYWPVERINFIEVLGGREEEEIIGFVRERS